MAHDCGYEALVLCVLTLASTHGIADRVFRRLCQMYNKQTDGCGVVRYCTHVPQTLSIAAGFIGVYFPRMRPDDMKTFAHYIYRLRGTAGALVPQSSLPSISAVTTEPSLVRCTSGEVETTRYCGGTATLGCDQTAASVKALSRQVTADVLLISDSGMRSLF
ncbi:hypothetical protein FE257_004882 [Aspergillus nanangensis]|uniref:Uncharacterized protein n=1 Tax=Aspergillus nanangensis TaxID=2582783 RepID=A0AAD4GN26_ASPNN|nr:hypothetical protein FE257_004882 [Aspergillus nanangensis]